MQMNRTILRRVLYYGDAADGQWQPEIFTGHPSGVALSLSAALPDLSKAIRHVPSDHYAPVVKSRHMLMFISLRISSLRLSLSLSLTAKDNCLQSRGYRIPKSPLSKPRSRDFQVVVLLIAMKLQ